MSKISTLELEHLEEQVHSALAANDLEGLRPLLGEHHAVDIADLIERLDEDEQHQIFELLSPEQAAEVLSETGGHSTRELITRLPSEEVGDLLEMLPADEVAEILSEDVPDRQTELLSAMEPQEAAEVRELLQYPPQSAGRLMTDRYVQVRPEMTSAETIEYLRRVNGDVETLTDLYVLNPQEQLIGVVSLREVITASPQQRIQDIMVTEVVAVPPETDQEEAARLVSHYNFLALPVIDADHKMLGIITVDDVIDVLLHEHTEDALRFAGVEAGVITQPYFTVPIAAVLRTRLGWLLLLFLAETITGTVLRVFQNELAQVVALSFFIPLLIGTGGNTGAQTVSTIIRGLALNQIRLRDAGRVIMRELGSGMLLGVVLGTVAFARALLWGTAPPLAMVVGLAIVAICTWANTIGSLIPLIAHKIGIDPAVVSAPLITTLVDATGLAIYLLIAKAVLGI